MISWGGEVYMPVVGSSYLYVSKRGKVLSTRHSETGQHVYGRTDRQGYTTFSLGNKKAMFLHRMVLFAWVGPPPDRQICRHLDGNPQNNNLSNLKWGTHKENSADRILHQEIKRGYPPTKEEPVAYLNINEENNAKLEAHPDVKHYGKTKVMNRLLSQALSDEQDGFYEQARKLVIQQDSVNPQLLQRRLKLNYAQAAELITQLEDNGVVSKADGGKYRKVLKQGGA